MNWQDRVDNIDFSIQTGDGKTYFPLYKGGEKEKEFNTSSFEFINVYGTLVDRKKPQGGKFPLVFWFQGANNTELADEFEASCDDPRPWEVVHPFYGTIKGQPISIKRDDSSLNITEVTVPFWESIDADYPTFNFSVKDNTREMHKTTLFACALSAVTNVEFAPLDIAKMQSSLMDMEGAMEGIQDGNTYSEFQNALNSAIKAIDNLLEDALNAIQNVQNFMDLPTQYIQAIEGRVASYVNIYNNLKNSIESLVDMKIFESLGGSVLACISLVTTNPFDDDYVLVSDVDNMTNRIASLYNDYRQTLSELQLRSSEVDAQENSINRNVFIPDATSQLEINTLINYTLANLYKISFTTKRERIVVVDKKTNMILLVHKYLGIDADDENIKIFKKTNNILFKENFAIEKGREIKYAK